LIKLLNFRTLLILLFFTQFSFTQVVFRDFPNIIRNNDFIKYTEFSSNSEIISLNGKWEVFPSDNPEKKFSINVPSIFEGEGNFIYEKKIDLSKDQVTNKKIELFFVGLNYSADISLNNVLIYRHTGGDLPFSVSLPRDILYTDKKNVVQVNLFYKLTSETTIPLKKRFFFPKNYGGIIRDVFLKISPSVNIQTLNLSSSIDFSANRARLEINSLIENKESATFTDTSSVGKDLFSLKMQVISPDGKSVVATDKKDFHLRRNKEIALKSSLIINSPVLWAPDFPTSYTIKAEIYRNEILIDQYTYSYSIYELKSTQKNLVLNNKPFQLRGATYTPTYMNFGPLISLDQMENDIKKIKQSGFNAIRIYKAVPHPYLLKLCEVYGLISIIDLPISDLPEEFAVSQNFNVRVKNYLQLLLKYYNSTTRFSILNLGSSYISYSESHKKFLKEISHYVKGKKDLIVSASFYNLEPNKIDGIDLYGIELINESVLSLTEKLENIYNNLGKGRVYFSEATYTVSNGHSDGYVNKFSFEGQSKFFEDLIKYSENNYSAGYIINSIFDYRGDFASLFFPFGNENVYQIGLISEDRKVERPAYKVVVSYLQDIERVTIPIGSTKDDSPMIFIITGLFLSLLMGTLINSGKKFREDATRALLRPYNFFADIRDQRIISGYQSIFLLIIICFTGSLIASNVLHYFRSDLLVEKLILAFGSKNLASAFSYLAWNPLNSIVWLFLLSLTFLFGLMVIIRVMASFVRNKVYVSSVFFLIVWSLLPLVLFIPLGIILYRLLNVELFNFYLYILLITVQIWLIFRIIKGIYVVYDVNPGPVYLYSFLFILLIVSGILLYFEIDNSLFANITLVLKQFKVLS
jgi:beta-galactosidase